ncbi:MAG: TrpB-like pyridoxal phosphate-dependent enzyme [Rhizobiales bacterium]|nr:TrpB-like pyridoxal phosphate-dependent enzyme [Hyphomicrobiales bacterium]
MTESTKYLLSEDRLPKAWYNLNADLAVPTPPPLHPGTGQLIGPDDLAPIFPMAVIAQEVTAERWVEIPEPVREVYRLWRPSPLIRARRLEKALGTCARIYFKYEGVSPAGSHKPNTSVPQAFYNKQEGVKRLATETGACQWGSSLAFAGSLFGLEVEVFMVKISYEQKPYRRALMETYGATCIASPSPLTHAGRAILEKDPHSNGSLGIAISEAVEVAASRDDTKYALGSVLNHVCLHQTVIGEEAMMQMEMAGDQPDIVIACTGGGSNFAGLAFPYIRENLKGAKVRVIGVEPASCPTLTKGLYAYDFGDTGKLNPLIKMHTLGATFMPPGSHAGGLRYHGMAPMVSHVKEQGLMEARAYHQTECFAAGVQFARCEGIVPAPEANHAVRGAIKVALEAKAMGTSPVILFGLCGHGHFDMQAYMDYAAGKLEDRSYDQAALDQALAGLPKVAAE